MRLSVKNFQELYKAIGVDLPIKEKSDLLVQIYTGKDEKQLAKLPKWKYELICKRITAAFTAFNDQLNNAKPIETVKVNGNWYRLNLDIRKADRQTGRYVEVSAYSKDLVNNLHNILASMAVPMRVTWKGLRPKEGVEHEAIAKDMLDLDFITAFQSALFFWAVFDRLTSSSGIFSRLTAAENPIPEDSLQAFRNYTAGSIMVKWLQTTRT